MFNKVTRDELESILVDLDLISKHRGIGWYGSGITPDVRQSVRWWQNIGGKCLDDVVKRLDDDDNEIDDKINLLLEHLGLEIEEGKRIVKKKKGKK